MHDRVLEQTSQGNITETYVQQAYTATVDMQNVFQVILSEH